jgi:phosphatidate cytidylyltransferase
VLPLDGSSSIARGVIVGVAVGLAGFLGDLVASMVKRDLGVKDLGRLLPGHGGVLDRVDGLLLALPVGHALLVVLP